MKARIMILATLVVAIIFCYSCKDTKSKVKPCVTKHIVTNKDTTFTLKDSMINELRMAHKRSMELFADEQFNKYVEYVYPQVFRYLKDKNHSNSVIQEKEKYVDLLIARNEQYWEKTISIVAPNTISYSFAFHRLEHYYYNNNNIAVIYSQRAFYVTNTKKVWNPNLDYGLAIYFKKTKRWYLLDFNNKDLREILSYDFDSVTVKDILTDVQKLKHGIQANN